MVSGKKTNVTVRKMRYSWNGEMREEGKEREMGGREGREIIEREGVT